MPGSSRRGELQRERCSALASGRLVDRIASPGPACPHLAIHRRELDRNAAAASHEVGKVGESPLEKWRVEVARRNVIVGDDLYGAIEALATCARRGRPGDDIEVCGAQVEMFALEASGVDEALGDERHAPAGCCRVAGQRVCGVVICHEPAAGERHAKHAAQVVGEAVERVAGARCRRGSRIHGRNGIASGMSSFPQVCRVTAGSTMHHDTDGSRIPDRDHVDGRLHPAIEIDHEGQCEMFIDFLKGMGESLLFIAGVAIPLGAMIGFAIYQLAMGDRMREQAEESAAAGASTPAIAEAAPPSAGQHATPLAS